MTPHELAEQCAKAIAKSANFEPMITLELPAKRGSRSKRYREPFGPRGPRGIILSSGPSSDTCQFLAMDVLAFLAARGLVDVQFGEADDD